MGSYLLYGELAPRIEEFENTSNFYLFPTNKCSVKATIEADYEDSISVDGTIHVFFKKTKNDDIIKKNKTYNIDFCVATLEEQERVMSFDGKKVIFYPHQDNTDIFCSAYITAQSYWKENKYFRDWLKIKIELIDDFIYDNTINNDYLFWYQFNNNVLNGMLLDNSSNSYNLNKTGGANEPIAVSGIDYTPNKAVYFNGITPTQASGLPIPSLYRIGIPNAPIRYYSLFINPGMQENYKLTSVSDLKQKSAIFYLGSGEPFTRDFLGMSNNGYRGRVVLRSYGGVEAFVNITQRRWYHIIVVVRESNQLEGITGFSKLYVDGKFINDTGETEREESFNQLTIGKRTIDSNGSIIYNTYKGKIAEFVSYNRLPFGNINIEEIDSEIANLYNIFKPKIEHIIDDYISFITGLQYDAGSGNERMYIDEVENLPTTDVIDETEIIYEQCIAQNCDLADDCIAITNGAILFKGTNNSFLSKEIKTKYKNKILDESSVSIMFYKDIDCKSFTLYTNPYLGITISYDYDKRSIIMSNTESVGNVATGIIFDSNKWNHIVVTKKGLEYKCYINKKLCDNNGYNTKRNNEIFTNEVFIGTSADIQEMRITPFKGIATRIREYGKILSIDEIEWIYAEDYGDAHVFSDSFENDNNFNASDSVYYKVLLPVEVTKDESFSIDNDFNPADSVSYKVLLPISVDKSDEFSNGDTTIQTDTINAALVNYVNNNIEDEFSNGDMSIALDTIQTQII